VAHYNTERPHRALALLPPAGNDRRNQPAANTIERHDLLGGLIHEYRAAA
jgi:putative transposase